MTERRTSLSAGLAVVAAAWIVAYWWWDPSPAVRFDDRATVQAPSVATQQDAAPPEQTTTGQRETGPSSVPAQAIRADEPGPVEPEAHTPRPAARSYIIEHGDTLSEIAQRAYGSARYAPLLFEHNRERLDLASPDAIRPGQTLELPSVEADVGERSGDE